MTGPPSPVRDSRLSPTCGVPQSVWIQVWKKDLSERSVEYIDLIHETINGLTEVQFVPIIMSEGRDLDITPDLLWCLFFRQMFPMRSDEGLWLRFEQKSDIRCPNKGDFTVVVCRYYLQVSQDNKETC